VSAIVAASYVASGGSTLVSDAFNRADSGSSLGTADVGGAWTAHSGTWGIETNKARCFSGGNQSFATIDAGVSDCTIAVTMSATLNAGGGITFRFQDTSNTWFIDSDSGGPALWKVIAGSYTQVVNGLGGVTLSAGDILSIVLAGNDFDIKKNGSSIYTTSQSQLASATRHGLRDYGAGARFDDFTLTG